MATKIRWGDTLDDDEVQIQMPQGSVTGPDERGVTTTVEYKRNEKGDIMKITTRVKTSRIQRKVYKVRHPQPRRSRCASRLM
jgi:translation initiation factor 3 subunit G